MSKLKGSRAKHQPGSLCPALCLRNVDCVWLIDWGHQSFWWISSYLLGHSLFTACLLCSIPKQMSCDILHIDIYWQMQEIVRQATHSLKNLSLYNPSGITQRQACFNWILTSNMSINCHNNIDQHETIISNRSLRTNTVCSPIYPQVRETYCLLPISVYKQPTYAASAAYRNKVYKT